ncbi:MAG: hybrid sensor histidine kinase/response regulator, partial [Longimicrobiales bacterium]
MVKVRKEYSGREVAVSAIRPLLDALASAGYEAPRTDVDPEATRVPWDVLCRLLEEAKRRVPDLAAIGASGMRSVAYKFRKRIGLTRRVLTIDDAVRFILYPRSPIDFACVNVAVTSEPGRVDAVAYVLDRYQGSKAFFELMGGAAEELVRVFDLPEGRMTMTTCGREAHLVITYRWAGTIRERLKRTISRQVHALYSLMVIRSSYPYLVQGRKMFEEQLVARRRVEARLVSNERAFERRIQHIDDVIAEIASDGSLDYVSPNLEGLLGASAADVLLDLERVIHPDDLDRVRLGCARAVGQSASARIDDFRVLDAEGKERWVEVSFSPLQATSKSGRTIGVARDVTERRRYQEELRRFDRKLEESQRLEMLGVLAGGIAHDFNNLLMPILMYADTVGRQVEDSPELANRMETIRSAAQQAADLVRQLMVYAGGQSQPSSIVDLSQEIRDMLDLIRAAVSENIELRLDLDNDARVRGDPSQLRQVVLNLVVNAAEAIGNAQGSIDLAVRVADGAITLSVKDDGCGMDAATQSRVFEPFYSTKFAGRGLGLSTVMGIVRDHGGKLRLESKPGSGTLMEVVLSSTKQPLSSSPDPVALHGLFAGQVLLADDDELVREAGREMLESLGCDVALASDGEEALSLVQESEFSALVLDLVMPKVDGRQVLRSIR